MPILLQSTRSTSASPSPRQLPTLVTTTWERLGRTCRRISRSRRGEQLAVLDRRTADAQIGHELGIDPMPDIRTGIADRKTDVLEDMAFRRGRGFEAGGAGNDRGVGPVDLCRRCASHCRRSVGLGFAGLTRDCGRNRPAKSAPAAWRRALWRARCFRAPGTRPWWRSAMPPCGPRSQTGANLSLSTTPPSSKTSSTSQRVPL